MGITRRSPIRSLIYLGACSIILGGLTTEAEAQGSPPPLEILYGFTLIDGRGGPALEDAAMAIRGNEILTVASRRDLLTGPNAPRDALVVNLGGGYVVPGLIDTHVHLATAPDRASAERELYRLLYSGVTAVRDMAGDGRELASLAREARLGTIPAPDVFYSALMAGPTFHNDPRPQASAAGETAGEVPWMQSITPDTDIRTAVAMARGTSAQGIKIYANLEPSLVQAITDEGHRQGMQVWAHSMVFPSRPLEVVEAGVDVISHVCRIAWEGMADAPTEYHHDRVPEYSNFDAASPVFTELFREMRARRTVLDATLAMYARQGTRAGEEQSDQCELGFARALVQRAASEGISISAGTDFTTPPDDPFPALFEEIEELVAHGGLSPMAAIESATRIGAEAIGAEDTHGVLEHGRPVTFVLLEADPLEDITNLRTVKAVWKNAVRFDRASYDPPSSEAATGPVLGAAFATPRDLLDEWLRAWATYDLDVVGRIFLRDRALTYFAHDGLRVAEGFESVEALHADMGFTPGGFTPEMQLWLDDVLVSDFGASAVISADWQFGDQMTRTVEARGPLTLVALRTNSGYRISHLHMGQYAARDR